MWQLSTKGRYGTRIMYQLAMKYGNGPMLLKEIAANENLPLKYLEHIIPILKKHKLVISTRGPQGGYQLFKDPKDISIKMIIEALEGDIAPTSCVESPQVCEKNTTCKSRKIWAIVDEKIKETLKNITLHDMIEDNMENSLCKNIVL